MTRPMSKMLMYVSIFFAILFSVYGIKKGIFLWFKSHYQPPPTTVSTTIAQPKSWQTYHSAVGTIQAINGVDIATEVPGIIQEIRFNSGQYVKKGDVLVLMRTTSEQATLKNQRAKLQLAKLNYQREQILFAKHVSSQATLDMRHAELLEAQAGVESVEAQIQQKTIVAPFDGRLGIKQVNIGQYTPPGTAIVTLQSVDPLYVMFNLPEQYLADLYLGQDVEVNVNIGEGKIVHGKITAINSKVEPSTRNVLIQVSIPNENYRLYPGMYGFVKVLLKQNGQSIVIPQTAISYSLSGDYVYLIKNISSSTKPDLRVYRQAVKVSERRGNEATIINGLKAGDQLVASGQLKLNNDTRIVIDNSVEL
jgi:membrane fusion protein (multidrug efflux system)